MHAHCITRFTLALGLLFFSSAPWAHDVENHNGPEAETATSEEEDAYGPDYNNFRWGRAGVIVPVQPQTGYQPYDHPAIAPEDTFPVPDAPYVREGLISNYGHNAPDETTAPEESTAPAEPAAPAETTAPTPPPVPAQVDEEP